MWIFYNRWSNKILGILDIFYYINVEVLIKLSQLFQNISLICTLYLVFIFSMVILLNKIKKVKNKI